MDSGICCIDGMRWRRPSTSSAGFSRRTSPTSLPLSTCRSRSGSSDWHHRPWHHRPWHHHPCSPSSPPQSACHRRRQAMTSWRRSPTTGGSNTVWRPLRRRNHRRRFGGNTVWQPRVPLTPMMPMMMALGLVHGSRRRRRRHPICLACRRNGRHCANDPVRRVRLVQRRWRRHLIRRLRLHLHRVQRRWRRHPICIACRRNGRHHPIRRLRLDHHRARRRRRHPICSPSRRNGRHWAHHPIRRLRVDHRARRLWRHPICRPSSRNGCHQK